MTGKPISMNFRQLARQYTESAKQQLQRSDESGLRCACLELRMAVEALVFDSLKMYLDDVPANVVMEKWTPRQVLSELLKIDKHADQSITLQMGPEASGQLEMVGRERRFTLRWADKAHNALSSFLHSPTINQVRSNSVPDAQTIKRKAEEIVSELDAVLISEIWNLNFRSTVSFPCDCGFVIRRRETTLANSSGVPCPQCRTVYRIKIIEGGFRYRPWDVTVHCQHCEAKNTVNMCEIFDGAVLNCASCSRHNFIQFIPYAFPSEPDPF